MRALERASAPPRVFRRRQNLEDATDWIEQWFGVSPDGRDGTLELLLNIVMVTAIGVIVAGSPRARALMHRSLAAMFPGLLRKPSR